MNDAEWRRHNPPPPLKTALGEHVPDSMMPAQLNAEQEKHWQDCALCQHRVARAGAAVDAFDDLSDNEFAAAVAAHLDENQPPASAQLPHTFAQSLFGPSTPADVVPGHIWQLQWLSQACLVAVVSVRGWHATVAPVTTDVHLAGADTVVVDGEASPLQVGTAVWLAATMTVPLAAFARELGPLAQLNTETLAHALRHVRKSGTVGVHAPHGIAGREVQVDTLELTDAVQAALGSFASADRALTDVLHGPTAALIPADLADRLRQLPPAELAAAGLSRAELLPVLRGAPLTGQQAAALAPLLNVEPAALLGGPDLPEELLVEASSPRWSAPRRAFCNANSYTDTDGLLALTQRAYTLAARSTSRQGVPDWRSRVAYVLADYGASEQ